MKNELIRNKEVAWKVFDISVYGRVTEPKNNEMHPAVLFVAGSGPTDSNWRSPLLSETYGGAKLEFTIKSESNFLSRVIDYPINYIS